MDMIVPLNLLIHDCGSPSIYLDGFKFLPRMFWLHCGRRAQIVGFISGYLILKHIIVSGISVI